MKYSEAARVNDNIIQKFGLPFKFYFDSGIHSNQVSEPGTNFVFFEPTGLHPNQTFKVRLKLGWRSIELELLFGKFAAYLVDDMGRTAIESRRAFSYVAEQILNEKGILELKINSHPVNIVDTDAWPIKWKSVELYLKKSPLAINTEDHALTEQLINLWVERYFGCLFTMIPLEPIVEDHTSTGEIEGDVQQVLVTRYERSKYNRTMCINFHGTICKACEINLEKVYGALARGFVHVHHIIPVSELGPGYIVNPVKDLVPVCPNCHSIMHRKNPPLSVNELKDIIRQSNN